MIPNIVPASIPKTPGASTPACALLIGYWIGVMLLWAGAVPAHAAPDADLRVESVVSGAGDPVLLIPGLSCGADVWDEVVAALQDEYTLHALTLPGFAGTAPLPEGTPFLDTVRNEVLEYVRRRGLDRPVLVGHSLGAHLAYAVAAQAPDEIGAVVAVDGLPFLGGLQNPAASPESLQGVAEQMRSAFAGMTTAQFRQQNEMALRTMIRATDQLARVAESSGRSDPATVGRAIAELMTSDLRAELVRIEVPVLQFGAFGGLPTPEMKEMMQTRYEEQIAAARNSRFVAAPTLHFVMLDDLDFFLAQLDSFLREVRP